jgi:hypothetical protein
VANGHVWSWRNLAVYLPVVLSTYGLTAAIVDALTGDRHGQGFFARAGLWALAGWWVPLLFLPAALILLALASFLPMHWTTTRRRAVLLVAAPLLFTIAMWAGATTASGNAAILTSPHLAVVVVPALAYAATVRLP